ncbi:MAG: hypothetical protein AAF485_31775, partial [Chloroflexota bacterium]
EALSDQDGSQRKQLQSLQQEMKEADTELRDEMRETNQQLTTDKVDRAILGDLFIELGNQLKTGGSVNDLLAQLGDQVE